MKYGLIGLAALTILAFIVNAGEAPKPKYAARSAPSERMPTTKFHVGDVVCLRGFKDHKLNVAWVGVEKEDDEQYEYQVFYFNGEGVLVNTKNIDEDQLERCD